MNSHTNLRTALEVARNTGAESCVVLAEQLAALIDAFDAARKSAKPKGKASAYPAPFEEAWQAYPQRSGANKATTYRAYTARINDGATPADLLAGAKRYAEYVKAERTEERFIKQPATFFGPDEHYKLDWTATKATGQKGKLCGPIGKQDYSSGVGTDGSF